MLQKSKHLQNVLRTVNVQSDTRHKLNIGSSLGTSNSFEVVTCVFTKSAQELHHKNESSVEKTQKTKRKKLEYFFHYFSI